MEPSTPSLNHPNECCNEPENLEPVATERPDLTMTQCKVCRAKHYELNVDPGMLGWHLAPLDGSDPDPKHEGHGDGDGEKEDGLAKAFRQMARELKEAGI